MKITIEIPFLTHPSQNDCDRIADALQGAIGYMVGMGTDDATYSTTLADGLPVTVKAIR